MEAARFKLVQSGEQFSLHTKLFIYKYYILERMIVRNVTLRNMIINRGEVEVDNYMYQVREMRQKLNNAAIALC